MERYQELAFAVKRIHRVSKVEAIPIVNAALGTVSKNAEVWSEKLSLPDFFESARLSVILGTAHILRKVLCL